MVWYTISLIKKVCFCICFLRFLGVSAGSSTIYRFLSQCIKTGYDLLYIAILLRELMRYSEVKLTELKYYLKRESQCLSKRPFNVVVGLRRFLQKSYKPLFYEVSRTKYQNLFLFMGQFRYVSTATNQEIVENFGGNNIDRVESWKSFLKFLDQHILTYYVLKENGDFPMLSIAPFPELLEQIRALHDSYCSLISMLLKQNYDAGIKVRVSSKHIPSGIEKLQQLFIESPVICLLAIYDLKSFSASIIPGADNAVFISVKKKKQEKDKLCWLLYNKCNVKSLRQNYRGSIVRRVWVPRPGSFGFQLLGIPTLCDRVFQTIVHMALMPIAEWQVDSFSPGF